MDTLSESYVQLLLDAALWAGAPDQERSELHRLVAERANALAHASKGAPCGAVHRADERMRVAHATLLQSVCTAAGMQSAALTEAHTTTFLVNLMCTGRDASAEERNLARRASAAAVAAIRDAAPHNRVVCPLALAVLATMRAALADGEGVLTYEHVLIMHRAVAAVFSAGDVATSVRRARLVVELMGSSHFDRAWDGVCAYEGAARGGSGSA